MDNDNIQLVGGPCGQHGPYTFYKAFRYRKNGVERIVTLSEFFFVKLWMDSDLLCIGELQLLWIDKNSEQILASLRLYFLPENTPEGRMDHGEDEVLAIAEKVVLRVEDLVTWITVDAEWTWGRLGIPNKQAKEPPDEEEVNPVSLSESSLDFADVEKEKRDLEASGCDSGPSVVILSYPRYCRYRAMLKRLEGVEDEHAKCGAVRALGGFTCGRENTRVMFCKDTFDYPELEGHEMLCNHLAPKLKGRPRGRRKKRSVSPGSESNESESSTISTFNNKPKLSSEATVSKNGICQDGTVPVRRSTRSTDNSDTKEFLKKLAAFMKMKETPLGRTPCLGYKEIDLYEFYSKVQKLGGYDSVTSNRLWKSVFDDMSGHQNSTGAATIIRRHYERFLLSYERHMKGEEYKPLPVSERRRLKIKAGGNKSESETSEEGPRDDDSPTDATSASSTDSSPTSIPLANLMENSTPKLEGKTSSLRSVRVKIERQKEKFTKVVKMEEINMNDPPENAKNNANVQADENDKSETKEEEKEQPPTQPPLVIEIPNKNEPLTSAVAPIAQKSIAEEANNGEEDKAHEAPCAVDDPDDVDKVKPEVGNIPFVREELKKDKLDILKEGGLEVTPVPKESSRPSVIQTMKTDLQQMPPPKRLPINVPQSLNISKVPAAPTFPAPFPVAATGVAAPPKVVQSKSIYSYSEKTVYGNPKDCLMTSYQHLPVHAPVNLKKQTGGDLLDLSVASPQKPCPSTVNHNQLGYNYNYTPTVSRNLSSATSTASYPLFEGRKLGSNLEITLVDSKNKPSANFAQPQQPHRHQSTYHRTHNKRVTVDTSNIPNKIPKIEENGKYGKPSTSAAYRKDVTPNPYNSYAARQETTPSHQRLIPETTKVPFPPSFPQYMSQFYDNKNISPYFQMIDPLLYSAAMQGLYQQQQQQQQSHVNAASPFLQFASPEQIKLYAELMSQNAQFPYPMPPKDGEFSSKTKRT